MKNFPAPALLALITLSALACSPDDADQADAAGAPPHDGGSGMTGSSTTGSDAGSPDGSASAVPDAARFDSGTSADGAATDAGQGQDASKRDAAPDSPADADSAAPEAGTPPATDCKVPKLPAASQLSAQPKHPNPFKMLDGSAITRKTEWPCRRAEIQAQVEEYEAGPKPSVGAEDVRATWAGNTLSISVSNAGKSIQFSVNISRPAEAAADPIPLLISFTVMALDSSVFAQNGVATLTFSHDALGAQSGGGSRGTGLFYDLYGRDHPASSMVAWAWGVSRILDALEKTPAAKIDPRRVAVTGCSRYGKGALLAGALDERIALTIPQESGAGGSASWRVSQTQSGMGVNVQTLSSAAGEQPWFRASFGQTFGGNNVTKLPFDQHMVMGLVAPRPLLVIDNAIDWLGIDSSFTSGSIAHTIWEALGLGERMGYSQSSGHTHCQFPSQQRAILDAYVKKFLVGTGGGDTRVLKAESAKANLGAWMDWTPPTLQ